MLAAQFGRTRSSIYRVINEMRARRILETKLEFMPHPSFDDPAAAAAILAPMPAPADGKAPRRPKAPKGLPPYLASLYEVPLLDREQEAHLFRKMNFLKYQANQLREQLDPARAKTADLDEIERLQEEALAVKNQIIRANLRLVVSIAKRHVGPTNNFFELVSDGNMSLIRAVEKFDYARGNKFSTYASLGDHEELRPHDPRGELPPRPVRHRPRGDVRGRRRQPHRRARVRERPEAACRRPSRGCSAGSTTASGGSSSAASASAAPASRPSNSSAASWASPRSASARSSPAAQDKLRKIAGEEKLDLPML